MMSLTRGLGRPKYCKVSLMKDHSNLSKVFFKSILKSCFLLPFYLFKVGYKLLNYDGMIRGPSILKKDGLARANGLMEKWFYFEDNDLSDHFVKGIAKSNWSKISYMDCIGTFGIKQRRVLFMVRLLLLKVKVSLQ